MKFSFNLSRSRFGLASYTDEHGFKAHCSSESHQKNMIEFAQDPTKFIEKHSEDFHSEFISLLSSRYKDKRMDANLVYQEVIANPEHVHLNATKWMTLTGFERINNFEICQAPRKRGTGKGRRGRD